jgi:hypothetical protein
MPLPFQPACLPLLLGSLPHRSASQALAVSRRYAGSLLAWPQLPQRSFREQSLHQAAAGFPGLVVDAVRGQIYVDRAVAEHGMDQLGLAYLTNDLTRAALSEEDTAGLAELVRQREGLRGVLAVKGQMLGPVSLAAQLTDEHQRPLIYDEMFFEALAHHLHLRAAWQSAQLAQLHPTTIFCLDEPFLDAVGLSFLPLDWEVARAQIDEVLAGVGGCRGLYAGGAVDVNRALQLQIDMLIVDVYRYAGGLVAAGAALAEFLGRDGIIGLGLVPADEEAILRETPEALVRRVEGLLASLEPHGIAPERLLKRAVIAPHDMLGRLTPEVAERGLQLLADTSRMLRERYTLE